MNKLLFLFLIVLVFAILIFIIFYQPHSVKQPATVTVYPTQPPEDIPVEQPKEEVLKPTK